MHIRGLIALSAIALAACGDDDKKTDTTTDSTADTTDTTDTVDTVEDTGLDTAPDTVEPDTVVPDTTGDSGDTDTVTPVEPDAIFAFRAEPGQLISEGPFPNDGLLEGGTIHLAPLGSDTRFAALAKAPLLARSDAQIATRSGFGFISAAFFPMSATPDLATFAGAVHYIALSGPEEGKVFDAQVAWFSHADYLAVFPAWGNYLVPGSKYGIVVDVGVKDEDGRSIEAPPSFSAVIAAEATTPTPALEASRAAFAELRAWLAVRDTAAVVGTVFTTEATLPFVNDLFAAVDDFALVPPSINVAHSAEGWVASGPITGAAALDEYFGVPELPFELTPTPWSTGARDNAAKLPAEAGGLGVKYAGGSFRGAVAYVVNGSLAMPAFNLAVAGDKVSAAPIQYEGGKPTPRTTALVPFTVFMCSSHLTAGAPDPDMEVPFAIFTHGGTAMRSDALPYAVANCGAGYATIALDLPFHGGRQEMAFADGFVAPARADAENVYSGRKAGDEGFVPDGIGDNGGATTTVGGLFALASDFDPAVIEANHISIATDGYTLVRYLKDGGVAGLGAFLGTKVDASHLVMESLSFGTSFTSALMAASDDFVGAVESVGTGGMISVNLPMAPNNAILAGGIFRTIYGLASTLPEVNAAAMNDPVISMLQWLAQRGDPAGYSPFVLRYRQDDHPLHVAGSGDSWDETLFSPAQLGFNNAWGVPVFTNGPTWTLDATIPGADTVEASAYDGPVSGNLTFDGRTQTAAFFYYGTACHAEVVTPLCESSWQPPYPPATARPAPMVSVSPLCALQSPVISFLIDIRQGEVPSLGAPTGSCADLYAP